MTTLPYPLLSFSFFKAYFILLRPYLMFISGIAGLLGICLSGQKPGPMYIPALLAFFLSYGFGQALTDSFQTDTDAISSPYRPLVRGEISASQVFWVSLSGLILCSAVLTWYNYRIFIAAIMAALGLILYTPFKRKWWGGPWWNSWIVALLVIMGKMIFVTEVSNLYDDKTLYGTLAVFFAYAVFVILGYLKDITADSETGYETFPVKYGWKETVVVGFFHSLAALYFSIKFIGLSRNPHLALHSFQTMVMNAFMVLSAGSYLFACIFLLKTRKEESSHTAIIFTVRAFLFLLSAMILSMDSVLWIPLVVFYGLFEIAMFNRPEVKQV